MSIFLWAVAATLGLVSLLFCLMAGVEVQKTGNGEWMAVAACFILGLALFAAHLA